LGEFLIPLRGIKKSFVLALDDSQDDTSGSSRTCQPCIYQSPEGGKFDFHCNLYYNLIDTI
jgi:hypothetical protein